MERRRESTQPRNNRGRGRGVSNLPAWMSTSEETHKNRPLHGRAVEGIGETTPSLESSSDTGRKWGDKKKTVCHSPISEPHGSRGARDRSQIRNANDRQSCAISMDAGRGRGVSNLPAWMTTGGPKALKETFQSAPSNVNQNHSNKAKDDSPARGSGRGRGVSNLPAWMTSSMKPHLNSPEGTFSDSVSSGKNLNSVHDLQKRESRQNDVDNNDDRRHKVSLSEYCDAECESIGNDTDVHCENSHVVTDRLYAIDPEFNDKSEVSATTNADLTDADKSTDKSAQAIAAAADEKISNDLHENAATVAHKTGARSPYVRDNMDGDSDRKLSERTKIVGEPSESVDAHYDTKCSSDMQTNRTDMESTSMSVVAQHEESIAEPSSPNYSPLRTENLDRGSHATSLPSDVEHIEEIQWGNDYDGGPRPKHERRSDSCGCTPATSGQLCCIDASCVLFACQEECRSNCEAGALCGNKRITKKQWKRLQVFDAGPKGRGLRSLEHVRKGDFITEYVGVAVKKSKLEELFKEYMFERMLYIMSLDSDVYIDARRKGGIARYINHSCEPNCLVNRWKVRGQSRAGIFAGRDIQAGEELSFDYQWELKRGRKLTKCYCNTPTCRGTLELPKEDSSEERELEMKLKGHWKAPNSLKAGVELTNRVIKVFFKGNQEYFAGDVLRFDDSTGKHLVKYRVDGEECWEDLSLEQWMILDEEAEAFVITRKVCRTSVDIAGTKFSKLSRQATCYERNGKTYTYSFIPSAVKEALITRSMIGRCERYCRVHINMSKCVQGEDEVDPATDDDEAAEERRALKESKDGVVWKLYISGEEPEKALLILQRNIEEIQSQIGNICITRDIHPRKESDTSYMILPRLIVDSLQNRLSTIRGHCQNVQVTFGASNSKSKQVAKLVLKSTQATDILKAQGVLWKDIRNICSASNAPMAREGIPVDFGFLAGFLTREQLKVLLCHCDFSKDYLYNPRESPFLKAFERAQSCKIWIQPERDIIRHDESSQLADEKREVFIGCDPHCVSTLWEMILRRVHELELGVEFVNLSVVGTSLPMLNGNAQRKGNSFFAYIRTILGVKVHVEQLTNEWLQLDGRCDADGERSPSVQSLDHHASDRAKEAKDLILLQVLVFKDHLRRQNPWTFGREWSEVLNRTAMLSVRHSSDATSGTVTSSQSIDDPRVVASLCLDLAEIAESLSFDGAVAAHAAVILFRFAHQISKFNTQGTAKDIPSHKPREVALACFFIANKAQKVTRWKRLEHVVEAAYNSFYPGSMFDVDSDEAMSWEKRVLAAEKTILGVLDHDVFWKGMDWILTVAVQAGKVAEPLAQNTLDLALSGPVLAAGPSLWIECGPEYAFTALAGTLSVKLTDLVLAFSLDPKKLSAAARCVVDAVDQHTPSRKALRKSSRHSLQSFRELSGMKSTIINSLPDVLAFCDKMGSHAAGESAVGAVRQFQVIARRSRRRRVMKDVHRTFVNTAVMPRIGGLSTECKCQIFLEPGIVHERYDILMEGSMRGLAVAEELLRLHSSNTEPVKEKVINPVGTDGGAMSQSSGSLQLYQDVSASTAAVATANADVAIPTSHDIPMARVDVSFYHDVQGGSVLSTNAIDFSSGWENALNADVNTFAKKGLSLGGKNCLCGCVDEFSLREAGLGWYVPPRYGPSLRASLEDAFLVRENVSHGDDARHTVMRTIGESFSGSNITLHMTKARKQPTSSGDDEAVEGSYGRRTHSKSSDGVAVSLKRWPVQKFADKEMASKGKMDIGFSPAALQEMQLFHLVHSLIPAPQGHPNFLLPLGIVLPSHETKVEGLTGKQLESCAKPFSPFNRSALNHSLRKKQECGVSSQQGSTAEVTAAMCPFILFEPTPLVLPTVLSRKKQFSSGRGDLAKDLLTPRLYACWFHDLLSALDHCHSNHVVIRTLKPDQILLDHSGVAKLSDLAGAVVLPFDQRKDCDDPLQHVRKPSDKGDTAVSDPHQAPEMLLGSTRFTKASDVWSLGSVMGNLLLGKQLFSGKDRYSLLNNIFKIAGSPSSSNFREAREFPHYSKAEKLNPKRYKPGVEKALRCMLKKESLQQDYEGAMRLLEKILHLDPRERMSASDALVDDYMASFVEDINSETFRASYAKEWVSLKHTLTGVKGNNCDTRKRGRDKGSAVDWLKEAGGEADDDLYRWDDILGSRASDRKRKHSTM